ncbi:HET-domain-containing protein [Hyaloscypha bicolor E]|uniref:HET-domain-containing protein n=1 Tax=Hyaloscypha bicolor E TaxID=1095630 RepID=A0A2J6TI65_9HELO|nr:HET-domain-containing protein [Hyaloscypha bicolor E]PMD62715.1 HET-domain-containing protein [Hyaloscypha bicolor E]
MAPLLPASMAQYTYSTLKPSNFRFLILLPGDGDDIVNCLLQESIIRQPNSEYEALSYVWGDDKKPHLVLCEGKELAVTTSLWTALRRLRLPQERRTLWADAICINQADLGERADQVQLMRQIYDGAARVIIWLGEETDVMRRAFPLIDHFTISNQIVLQHFFENPWFLRAWVFQEAVCAKSAIVQCGGLQIDFEILELFATLFFVNELTTILPTAESRGSHHQLYAIRNVRRLYARGEKHTIFRLLAGSAGAGAKDPRDQLFSLARDCSRAAFTVPP